MRRAALFALCALGCTGPLPGLSPNSAPISAELLCSEREDARDRRGTPGDLARCEAAVAPRIEAMKRSVLDTWQPPLNPYGSSFVQIQFELDAAGKPVNVCVLGGTGDAEARSALAAIARYESLGALPSEEACVIGHPLVATLITEGAPPR